MKTVFKTGMEVYDQMFFPDMKGKVVKIDNDESKYPLGVCFNGKMNIHYYDLEGRFRKEHIPTLSTKPYKVELVGFEQKASVPTFEEALKNARSKGDYYYLPDCLEVPSEELADATIALLKLLFLRDYYNEGWQPDWKDDSYKEILCFETDFHSKKDFKYRFYASKNQPRILAFKNSEIRAKFIEEQKELLEIAKPLL